MADALVYNTHVGKEVASLKPLRDANTIRFKTVRLEEGLLEAGTEPEGFEMPFVFIFLGALSGFLSWLSFHWDLVSREVSIGLTIVLGVASFVLIVYGMGRISAGKGLKVGKTRVDFWSRFLWYTRRKVLQGRPRHIVCTATRDPHVRGRFIFDVCLQFPPPHGQISVSNMDGYAQVERERAARCKPYELVLDDVHREAIDMASKLGVKLRPNFGNGPVPDPVRKIFDDEELAEPLRDQEDEEPEEGEEDEQDDG
jgi:hypothetical protein